MKITRDSDMIAAWDENKPVLVIDEDVDGFHISTDGAWGFTASDMRALAHEINNYVNRITIVVS